MARPPLAWTEPNLGIARAWRCVSRRRPGYPAETPEADMGYSIHTDVKFAPLDLVDARLLAERCTERWWNQSLCRVNDCVVRLGVFEGEFHWHKHDREDEYFHVLEGELLLDLEGRTMELRPGQG